MKIFLLSLLLLLGFTPAHAAIAFVHACSGNASASTTLAITCSIAAGDFAVAAFGETASGSTTFTVTDNLAQTWTQTSCGYATKSPDRSGMFWTANSGTVTTITAMFSGAVNSRGVVLEFSGMAATSLEDGTCIQNGDVAAVTATSSPGFTTGNANDVLIYELQADSTADPFTAGAGYTIPTGGVANHATAVQYQIVSSTQAGVTASINWTTSRQWTSILAAFKAAPAGSTIFPRRNALIF